MIPVPHQALLGIQQKFDGHCDPTVGLLSLRPMDPPKPGFGTSVCGLLDKRFCLHGWRFLVGTKIFPSLP
jgi:hypothetical protein